VPLLEVYMIGVVNGYRRRVGLVTLFALCVICVGCSSRPEDVGASPDSPEVGVVIDPCEGVQDGNDPLSDEAQFLVGSNTTRDAVPIQLVVDGVQVLDSLVPDHPCWVALEKKFKMSPGPHRIEIVDKMRGHRDTVTVNKPDSSGVCFLAEFFPTRVRVRANCHMA
jgi:hypothetical protein